MSQITDVLKALIEGLTEEQAKAVEFPPVGRLRLSAGAGSGKTEVLTRRIDALLKEGIKPSEMVAITYTTKAASEMKTRLIEKRKLSPSVLRKMEVSTFHAFLSKFLKTDPFGAGIDSSVSVIAENARKLLMVKLSEAFTEMYGEQIVNGKNALGADIASMLFAEFPAALSKIRRYLLGPGEFYRKALADLKARTPEGTDLEFKTLEWLYLFYSHYMNELEKRNLLDFDEILIRSKNLVKDMREGGVLPERRIFLIDEFQDNNPYQLSIVEEFCRDRESQICVIGDEKQSIYRFQGANVDTFRNFVSDQDIILRDNFRSYSQIINFADSFLLRGGDVGKMFAKQEARRGDSPRYPAVSCLLSPEEMDDKAASVEIADMIKAVVASGMTIPDRRNGGEERPIKYGDIAIILNSIKNLPQNFEDCMSERQIPYVVSGGCGLYERSEIEEMLAYLKLLVQPNDDYAVVKILTGPLYGLKDSELAKIKGDDRYDKISLLPRILAMNEEELPREARNFRKLYVRLKERANKPGLVNLCHTIIEQAGFYEYSASIKSELKRRRINNNIAKFLGIVRDFEQNGVFTSLRDFLKHVELTQNSEIDEDEAGLGLEEGNAVKIMTIHKSKGLEFPMVIVPFLKKHRFSNSDKVVYDSKFGFMVSRKKDKNDPSALSPVAEAYREQDKQESFSEDFRKLYVAFTRAEDLLIITGKESASLEGAADTDPITITEPVCHTRLILEQDPTLGQVKTLYEWKTLVDQWCSFGQVKIEEAPVIEEPKVDMEMLTDGIKSISSFLRSRATAELPPVASDKDIFSLQELALFKLCPRKYYFSITHVGSFEERMDRYPTLVGKLAHETIRLFHENEGHKMLDWEEAFKFSETLLDKLIPCYTRFKTGSQDEEPLDAKTLKARTMILLNRYCRSDLSRQQPWMFEAEVNVKFEGNGLTRPFFIRGFADRVDRDDGGNIRIIDFKTREYSEEAHNGYKRQLALYRIASARGVLGESGCLNFADSYIAYLNPKGLDLRQIEPDLTGFEDDAAKVVAAIRSERNWSPICSKQCLECSFSTLCRNSFTAN